MIRSILIASLLLGGGFFISAYNVGYSTAGEKYISKRREERKSLRPGYYYGRPGYGGFRGGK
ncbi:MAG: hypothetical protein A2176_05755 [Spirochaetes bacterium RBG_13_51_14]|nr:MAG: hypothetical protein A2176_05755 [Spirochaetes bacterium RBG_13_51_14]